MSTVRCLAGATLFALLPAGATGATPTDTLPDGAPGAYLPDSVPGFTRLDSAPRYGVSDTSRSGTWDGDRIRVTVHVVERAGEERVRYTLDSGRTEHVAGHRVRIGVSRTYPASANLEYIEPDLRIQIGAEPRSPSTGLTSPDTLRATVRRAFSSIVASRPHQPHPASRAVRYVRTTVNLRAGPGTDYSVVRQVTSDDSIWVGRGARNSWRPVFDGESTLDTAAWVHADLVHVSREPLIPDEAARKIELSEGAKQRRRIADRLERRYLEQGLDVYVSVRGKGDRILRVEWVLAGRPDAYRMRNDRQLMNTLDDFGFRKFELTDGYGDWWSWEIP